MIKYVIILFISFLGFSKSYADNLESNSETLNENFFIMTSKKKLVGILFVTN